MYCIIKKISVPNTNSNRSVTTSCTVSKETEVRQKRQKIDDRHAHRDHVKPALADNYSKELDKLFGTDSECEYDYSDISSEYDSECYVQDEGNQKIPNRSRERHVILIMMRTLRLLNL